MVRRLVAALSAAVLLASLSITPVAATSPEFSGYTCDFDGGYRHIFVIRSTTNSQGFTYARGGATYYPTASCIGSQWGGVGAFVLPVNLQQLTGNRVLQIGWGYTGSSAGAVRDQFWYTPYENGAMVAWPGSMPLVEGEAYAFAIEKVLLANNQWVSEFRIVRVSTGYTEKYYGTWSYVYDDLWAGYETHDRASGHGRRLSASYGHQIRNIRYAIGTGAETSWNIVGATIWRNFSSPWNSCWGGCPSTRPRPDNDKGVIGSDGRFNGWHSTGPGGY